MKDLFNGRVINVHSYLGVDSHIVPHFEEFFSRVAFKTFFLGLRLHSHVHIVPQLSSFNGRATKVILASRLDSHVLPLIGEFIVTVALQDVHSSSSIRQSFIFAFRRVRLKGSYTKGKVAIQKFLVVLRLDIHVVPH